MEAARKEAMAQLAKLEGVTKWLVKLRLTGESADVEALAAGLTEKAGVPVTVTDVTSSLLSKTSYRACVEVEDLDKLAAVVDDEAAGLSVEGIEEAGFGRGGSDDQNSSSESEEELDAFGNTKPREKKTSKSSSKSSP